MIEYGIDKSLVERRDDSRFQRGWRKGFFSFRKMFWDYLTKLNVPFYDSCCPAETGDTFPLRFNEGDTTIERFDGDAWIAVPVAFNGGETAFTNVIATEGISSVDESTPLVVNSPVLEQHTAVPVNVTATVTDVQLANGYFTSTSAAAVGLTLPTATAFATLIGAVAGSSFEFIVDNSAGANTVTVIVGAGITVNTPAITGGATLTVSTANAVGIFRLVYTSATAAKIFRIA